MQHIKEKIDYLKSLGINYNLETGRNWLLANLESYHDIYDVTGPKDIAHAILIRAVEPRR